MTPHPYLTALREARAITSRIDVYTARRIVAAMREWARDVAAGIRGLPDDREVAAQRSVDNIERAARELEARINQAVAEGRRVTFRETLGVWQRAMQRVAESGVPGAFTGAVTVPDLTIARALPEGAAETFRSVVRDNVGRATQEVQDIVRSALLRGVSPDELARELVPYMTGRDRAPEAIAPDIEEQPIETRAAAFTMEHNAQRIAFSETHNARQTAEVQHFQSDPFIALGRWTLSPNRGTQRRPDVCDALAKLDWWGLGPGVFPLERIPLTPHPWDRCEVMPLAWTPQLRKLVEGKQVLRMVLDPARVPLPGQEFMTPRGAVRTRAVLSQILNAAPVRAPRQPVGV